MAIPHAPHGMPVDLRHHGEALSKARTTALVKNDTFEAIRMVVPKGHEVCHDHRVEGTITLQCLVGCVAFTADGETHELAAGHWLFLTAGVPHTITGPG
jgi:quercetin dioxygenase-like cupin family protein